MDSLHCSCEPVVRSVHPLISMLCVRIAYRGCPRRARTRTQTHTRKGRWGTRAPRPALDVMEAARPRGPAVPPVKGNAGGGSVSTDFVSGGVRLSLPLQAPDRSGGWSCKAARRRMRRVG